MRRVSRNIEQEQDVEEAPVTPRMRRVSRNECPAERLQAAVGHASHEACE